ncbi:MAG: aminomethyl-transferring glycine dehydrogenase subunit GcvPA [Phycisphaerae bacterium]
MRYTQFTTEQVEQMLSRIGVKSVDDLFVTIPPELASDAPLAIPQGVSEMELINDTRALSARNRDCTELVCFLGCGAYDHFIPSLVDSLSSQSELVTAYTPYQAEASQGILQLFYEFQTMVCMVTGMEVANASLYEVASAAAEAVIMAVSITRRRRAIVAECVHPDIMRVLQTYAGPRDIEVVTIPAPQGVVDQAALSDVLSDATAAVVLQSPNFFGCIERLDQMIPEIHGHGALAVVACDPIASALLKPPGDLGADVVVAEGQPLGVPLQYGGPYLGLLASREAYLRKMPGRVVGLTNDTTGRRGFCLALQTREQHIKRHRATSNICTNQGLLAVRAAVYLAAMGRCGLAQVASQCFDKAHYAAGEIAQLDGYELKFGQPFFKEFVVRTSHGVQRALAACRQRGILGGVPLVRFDDALGDCFSVAVTEKRTKGEIDNLVAALRDA